MPNRQVHLMTSGAAGALYALHRSAGQPEPARLCEVFGGIVRGYIGGRTPDVLEPPRCPRHRGRAHSVPAGGDEADELLGAFMAEEMTPEVVRLYGRDRVTKRRSELYGADYNYNPSSKRSKEWSPLMLRLRMRMESIAGSLDGGPVQIYPDFKKAASTQSVMARSGTDVALQLMSDWVGQNDNHRQRAVVHSSEHRAYDLPCPPTQVSSQGRAEQNAFFPLPIVTMAGWNGPRRLPLEKASAWH